MKLKESRHYPIWQWPWRLVRRLRLRWLVLLGMTVGVLAGLFAGGFWAGREMTIWYSRRGFTVRSWGRSLMRHQLGCVNHYLKGLTVSPERIDLDIKANDMAVLQAIREDALARGTLNSTPADWVGATLRYQGQAYRASVRLKGDMPDHWYEKDGWSLKVKLKNGKTMWGMRRFSLQHPWTRWFLTEWMTHRWLAYHDLIALRYRFVELWVNGKSQSIFAVEENFDKYLVEHNRLREGPILRINNDFNWSVAIGAVKNYDNLMDGAVEPGMPGGAMDDPAMNSLYQKAAGLMEQLRRGELTVDQVIDTEKMGLYFALFDLFKNDHVISLDNMRLYYNPISSRIEPVGYDCENLESLESLEAQGVRGYYPAAGLCPYSQSWYRILFSSRPFYRSYVQALAKISAEGYLERFLESVQADQSEALAILYKGYPWYFYEDETLLKGNRNLIHSIVHSPVGPGCYLHSYDAQRGEVKVQVRNLGILPVIIDEIQAGQWVLRPKEEALIYSRTTGSSDRLVELTLATPEGFELDPVALNGQVKVKWHKLGLEDMQVSDGYPWPAVREEWVGLDVMRQESTVEQFDFIHKDNAGRYLIAPGRHLIDTPLVVPAGSELRCGPGTVLEMQGEGMIISHSPIHWVGSEAEPVVMAGSEQEGMGMVVVDVGKPSVLEYVHFRDLTFPADRGWSVSGVLTFYESEVQVRHCLFERNRCEDYLNLVRSKFLLSKSRFVQTAGDALDTDFCEGRLEQMVFERCGNDAVDVSGTKIAIDGIRIEEVGDKGLSAGERSAMKVKNGWLDRVEIAVASKDESEMVVDGIAIHHSRVGFTAFQKKSEYGPGVIRADGVAVNDSEEPIMLEEGSTLVINGEAQLWTHKKIRDLFYGEQYGRASGNLDVGQQ